MHYIAIFATFPASNRFGYRSVCLALLTLHDKKIWDTIEHNKFIQFVLRVYGKPVDSLDAIIGYNCFTNQSLSNKRKLPHLGCAINGLQFAVRKLIAEDGFLDEVPHLTSKLGTQLMQCELSPQHTHLKAKLNNETRWTSMYVMLHRHIKLRDTVSQLGDEELYNYQLNASLKQKVYAIVEKLKELNDFVLRLKQEY